MRYITITILILAIGLNSFSQTNIIAHKSHNGVSETFSIESPHSFGIPPKRLVEIIKITDSTVVFVYDFFSQRDEVDTFNLNKTLYYSNNNYTADSLKKLYPSGIVFTGFDDEKSNEEKTDKKKDKKKFVIPFIGGGNTSILYLMISLLIFGLFFFLRKSQRNNIQAA